MNKMNAPFILKPTGKGYLWGGTRLISEFGKDIGLSPLAETWECSVHEDGPSYVGDITLKDFLNSHPEYVGNKAFNLLIKFIDAKIDLSVSVHPDDAYALANEKQNGKTEMWYVLDAKEDTKIVFGLKSGITKQVLEDSLRNGTIQECLREVPIKKGDVFLIKPGTVHSIGAGALIAEIQESSNLTYRLFDYDRLDKNGKKRELHIGKAMDVIDFNHNDDYIVRNNALSYCPGVTRELLAKCDYFETYKLDIDTQDNEPVPFSTKEVFKVLLCIDGQGNMSFLQNDLAFKKGDCIFVPANSIDISITGKTTLLEING